LVLMAVHAGYLPTTLEQAAVFTRDAFLAISVATAGAMSLRQVWHLLQGRTLHSPRGTHESLPVAELQLQTLFGVSRVSMLQNSPRVLLQSTSVTQRVPLANTRLSGVNVIEPLTSGAPLVVPSRVQGLKGAAAALPTVRLQQEQSTAGHIMVSTAVQAGCMQLLAVQLAEAWLHV
jgi:hypothetical protein